VGITLIENIKLRNFKSIEKDEIKLKPLTIFTGPNSSGKSNILEAIAVVSQIAKQASRLSADLPRHLENPEAEFYRYPEPSIEHLVHKGEVQREITIEIHLKSEISKQIVGYSVNYTSTPLRCEQTVFVNRNKTFHTTFKVTEKSQSVSEIEHPLLWKGRQTKLSAQVLLNPDSFIPLEDVEKTMKPFERQRSLRLRELVGAQIGQLVEGLGKVYLISAPRGVVPIQIETGPNPKWVGKYGQDLIHILSKIYGESKYRDIQRKISEWAVRFGIGSIGAGLRKGRWLGADFQDPNLNAILDMTSSSYGSRQLLTIITQVFFCKPGDTLLIEEPEISLHPESQVLVQELFSEVIDKGIQIICVTHSPFFILSLSKVLRQQKLSKEKVAIYHVEKRSDGTKTRLLELDDRGFVKGWIPSYINIENKLFTEWVEKLE
jgi:AAA15 family ATPase/GTPase